jgi:phytoene dehydrogenase-like protein
MNSKAAEYDAIVIGSGIGGLAAATRLSQRDKRTLLLEASDDYGGYIRPVIYGDYMFDLGVHYTGQLGAGESFRNLLDDMGHEDLDFVELDPDGFNLYVFPDYEFKFCKGKERIVEHLIRDFPHDEKGIQHFFNVAEKIDLAYAPNELPLGGMISWMAYLIKHPIMIMYGLRNFLSYLDSKIGDHRLKAVLSAPLFDIAVGASKATTATAMALWGYCLNGAYYPKGGSRGLRDAFVKRLRETGTDLVHSSLVTNLTKVNNTWVVRTEQGDEYTSRIVISNVDPKETICSLLDRKLLPSKIYKKAKALQPSRSVFSVFIGTDLNLIEMGFTNGNITYFSDWDLTSYHNGWPGASEPAVEKTYYINCPSIRDPEGGFAPQGHHTLQILADCGYDAFEKWATIDGQTDRMEYEELKKELCKKLVKGAENHIKGLSDHITMIDCITPLDCEDRVRAVRGGMFGPAHIPSQMDMNRFMTLTCGVEGLFLAGAGTIASGLQYCAASGFFAAEKGMSYLND